MAAKRKFDDYGADSRCDEQGQRQLCASKVEHCRYHDIFSHNPELITTRDPSIREMKSSSTESTSTLYTPLTPFQIRILKIESGEFNEPLRGSLFNVDLILESGVIDPITRYHYTYEAVSHSWGDQQPCGTMYCDNQVVALRESQHVMLKHLRSPCNARHVWLDTICINQCDVLERAAQVKKMFTIFEHAHRVLIWLGLPKARTMQVFNVIDRMKAAELLWKEPLSDEDPTITRFVPEMCSICHSELALGIGEFATFSWFRRTWVRQEVFASKAAMLRCGSFELPWAEFTTHIRALKRILVPKLSAGGIDLLTRQLELLNRNDGKTRLKDVDTMTGSLSFVYELFDQQTTQNAYDSADLFRVLATSGSFEASDPRDITYGVLGMSNTQTSDCTDGQPTLSVDYSWDASQVFRKTTEYFIQREKCLDAMFLAQFNRDPLGKLVSWCPYWPVMNCEPHELRQLCHVNLLHGHSISPAFDGKNWPRVIDAEDIDVHRSARPWEFCFFKGDSLQIEGHALGIIKVRKKMNEVRKLALTVITYRFLRASTTINSTCEAPNKACNDYEPLHIEHMGTKLSAFKQRIRAHGKGTKWSQEEMDRFCVACVPAATKDGDVFCFLEASTAFIILRPLRITKNVCRVHFVGIAFASQGIFDRTRFLRPDAHDQNLTRNRAGADAEAFARRVLESSDVGVNRGRDQSSPHHGPVLRLASASTFAENRNQSTPKLTSKPHIPLKSKLSKPSSMTANNHPWQANPPYQRHFKGPVHSLKMIFDIV